MFATRATARSKMVTSGRLTAANGTRRLPKSRPEPAYSLYSTDSETQVATLHKGLDRCAALLSDILHCENQGAVPKQDRAVKDAVPTSRPHTPTGKKVIRRSLKSGSNPRRAQVVRRKSSTNPSTTTPQHSPAPPHCGVKLQPPVRKTVTCERLLKTPSKLSSPRPPCCPPLSPAQALPALDCVPERDQGPAEGREVARVEVEGKSRRVQCLLGELRTLMAGHGDSAQTYLHLLEQTVFTALGSETSWSQAESTSWSQAEGTSWSQAEGTSWSQAEGTSRSQAEGTSRSQAEGTSRSLAEGTSWSQAEGTSRSRSLAEGTSRSLAEGTSRSLAEGTSRSQAEGTSTGTSQAEGTSTGTSQAEGTSTSQAESTEVQLQRQVNVWNKQLQDQEAKLQLLNSQVLSLQERLCVTEKQLTNTQESLQETQSRLQSREEENIALKTELESTRGRLRGTLQDKFRLEGTVQQKKQEVEALRRIIDRLDSSALVPRTQPACPPGPAKEHITQYLLSLEPGRATQPPGARHEGPEHDVDSVISDWSVQSESSFNTRDEAAFRDGLEALDASIASLQKTLKMDLLKT